MFYISKFCRICVQPEKNLIDLNTEDFDKIKLSEKLETCTKMVVTKESISSEICVDCLSKLRTSYHFLNMCKKSTKKLYGYYKTLLSKDGKEEDLNQFINTELHVEVTPIRTANKESWSDNYTPSVREKRKRITKEQRCSLLKRLLTNPEQCKKERKTTTNDTFVGGLKDIIDFTKNYEFGEVLDKNSYYDPTALDKLKVFSVNFFKRDFSDFNNTILYIIENKDNLLEYGDSEEEEFFNEDPELKESNKNIVKVEEVIIEPDIKIKTEFEYDEGTSLDNSYYDVDDLPCKTEIKEELECSDEPSNNSSTNYDYPITPPAISEKVNSIASLNNFVGNYQHKRTFSPSNVRCRTRESPYINPRLQQQFLYRSFMCDKCSRYFKSPGYLKAHYSKIHLFENTE
ncbi:unnamed protein product [Phyllotreta striolata]|uniref:C2H2-type domain-containing protein n=1 Tax=Phyllotreta striolata TaxID=444603 RepID=A0A9N9TB75_PHYSR|nr:unnamed protein product [Phyllotreta striolata]